MSVRINVFRPVVTGASQLGASIALKVNTPEGDAETTLFFMESTSSPYNTDRDMTPSQHVLEFVTELLRETGFDFFSFSGDLNTTIAEDNDGEVYVLGDQEAVQDLAAALTY